MSIVFSPIRSSWIESIGYDKKVLYIHTDQDHVYRYFDVPESVYQQFLAARSKGAFFNAKIRNQYREQKLQ